MTQHPLHWNAGAYLKITNAIAREFLYFVSFTYDHPVSINPRADGGGAGIRPSLRFFMNSGKTAARSASKFCMPIQKFILRVVCKQ